MAWCIKGANRSAMSAFAPNGPYMAAGTMAGAVDLQFSSSANLDIFELDFASNDRQLILAGSAPSSERFNRISWGKGPADSEEYSLGLVAGGLVDGNIGLWNPKSLISSGTNKKTCDTIENALVGNLSRHRGPVHGLEFSSLSPDRLASGADEGDICIWDVSKPLEPTPLKGSGSATQDEISFLSWNSKAKHILASTSYNGTTGKKNCLGLIYTLESCILLEIIALSVISVVWDLNKQKPVISFSDSTRRRCSVLQWNPDVATQLIVASDEDSSPSLRLWDMRNIMSPVKEFVGHTKGVIAMSWCPTDSSYLLTCAKDNRTICWDTLSGEIVAELPAGTNWNFDVHWYSEIPGVISASSFDGNIGLYNIEGCGRYGFAESDFSAASFKAPKWYNSKAGVSFGFGGKLVSFNSNKVSMGILTIYLRDLVTEQGLVSRSSEFEVAIKNGDRSTLKLLCERKSQESKSVEERETWGFLKLMFNEEGTATSNILSHLGFSQPAEENSTLNNEISKQMNALDLGNSTENGEVISENQQSSLLVTDNGVDFFDNIPSPRADTPRSTFTNEVISGDTGNESLQELSGQDESSSSSFDDAVQRALVVGDYKGAIALCISENRQADALVIAHVSGPALWESTRDQYLNASHSPYLKVVLSAMVNNDLMSIAKTRPLKSWKETLALFCTFAQPDEWAQLCNTLAARLIAVNDTAAATLCYACARNIDKVVEIWSRNLGREHDESSYLDRLQDLMEKTIVFAVATGEKQFSSSLCKLIEKYAEILANQGLLSTAMEYLNLLGTEQLSTELMILRDRIALSTEPEIFETSTCDNSQLQNGYAYSARQSSHGVTGASQNYYPDANPSQVQSTVPSSPYSENYQQYNAPPTYQPVPAPNIQPTRFVPSPPVPASVPSYPLPPINTRPAAKFVPSNPPLLKNLEQYQQPSSLGSQLYPVDANPNYQRGPPVIAAYDANISQIGPASVQSMPQMFTPNPPRVFTPVSSNFTPVSSNSEAQRPGMNQVQHQPPQHQPTVTPASPLPTVQTVDTSSVPAPQKPVITTLTKLFNETSEALGGALANPAKKREIEDNSKKLGGLFAKLNSGDISANAAEKLVQLCQALDNGDFGTALQIQVLLPTSDWDECNFWLATLKRMIKTRQNLR
ncbi:Protein transport protein SEC31 homolog B [Striga hermonthica]|uniref:Protein transport protein SEC31 homolog B n=1 Tax=Striga hermonthica TaxID=68872 RepID=A0A9N7MZH7_STRHE|nr:Protein transport protein SEC31 homolog B [Striga hermonthica]